MASRMTNQERLNLRRDYAGPAFLKEGFRPLFLGAGLWAALSVPLWAGVWSGLIAYGGTLDPLYWHIHEMIYGFVCAAIGGFVLTAVPNWTGRLPVRGLPLAALALLWLLGRIAMWFGESLGTPVVAVIDLSYLTVLFLFVANEIFAGRNWRNLPVLVGIGLLLAGNALFHLDAMEVVSAGDLAVRLSISVVLMMIALIGGRIVPSFTRNWLARNDGPEIVGPMQRLDIFTLLATVVALLYWIATPDRVGVGTLLIVAGALNLTRLGRWKGIHTVGEPLLGVLHLAYFWLGTGLILLGVAKSGVAITESAGLHALTIGAMGTMVLAVMTRASLGHTGRPLSAGPATCTIYGLVTLAVSMRIAFEFWMTVDLIWVAAFSWCAAFVLFVAVYGPMLMGRRPKDAAEST